MYENFSFRLRLIEDTFKISYLYFSVSDFAARGTMYLYLLTTKLLRDCLFFLRNFKFIFQNYLTTY